MTWQITPFSVVTMLVAVMATATAIEVWRQRSARGGLQLALMLACIAEWCASVALESAAVGIPAKVFWSKVEYIGITCSMTFLLQFALVYSQQDRWLADRRVHLLWAMPATFTLLAWTNDLHGLLWPSLVMAPGEGNVLIYGHGPVFFVGIATFTLVLLLSSALLLIPTHNMARLYRNQVAGVAVGFIPPWVLGTIYALNPALVQYMDVSPVGFLFSALMLNWSLVRYRMLDLVPVARDTLVEEMSDGVLVLDAQDRIVDLNPAAEQLLQMASPSPIGLAAQTVLAAHPDILATLCSAVETRTEVAIDGATPRHLDVRVSALGDHGTETSGRLIVLRDITERKRLEEQLQRAGRLETAGQIAAQVSHDFNNLLVPMTAYPDLIKMQLPEDHPAVQFCDAMLESAQQMSHINEEMMVLGRRGHFDFEPTDLNHVVEQALAQLPAAPETLLTRTALSPELMQANGSSAQLLRVVMNLITNAREAMGDSGTLTIRTEDCYLDMPILRYHGVEIGEYVKLSVSDTGCGIPAEIRDQIFDAFFTARNRKRRRGAGLGLAIVQSVVTDHRGYVDLKSEVGVGTTFYVYLPVSHQNVVETPRPELRGGTESILVVDDDQLQREAASQMLKLLGYRVDAASSGESAINYLRDRKVDLLILDMVMPDGIDGTETYRRARQVRPGQRALIVSGFAETERVREAQALGAGSYVRKPVTLEKLARAVRQELDGPPSEERAIQRSAS